jgi:hypothetical protein
LLGAAREFGGQKRPELFASLCERAAELCLGPDPARLGEGFAFVLKARAVLAAAPDAKDADARLCDLALRLRTAYARHSADLLKAIDVLATALSTFGAPCPGGSPAVLPLSPIPSRATHIHQRQG